MSLYEDLLAERYAEPTWFAKPVTTPEDDLAGRRRLAACVAEFDAVAEGRGQWVSRHGIKVWEASA